MESSEVKGQTTPKWKLPLWLQELIAAAMVPLLLASVIGWANMWRTTGEQALLLDQMQKDIIVLETWKTTFGQKPRFGAGDGAKIERRVDRLDEKLEVLRSEFYAHNQRANTYIERIEQCRKRLLHMETLQENYIGGFVKRHKNNP